MEATLNTRRFQLSRFAMSVVAFGFVAGLALGAAAPTAIDNLPALSRGERAAAPPQAQYIPQQGEGLLNGTASTAAERMTAHPGAGMGEGLVGGHSMFPAASAPKPYWAIGQGEGWLINGRPADTLPPVTPGPDQAGGQP